MNIFPLLLSPLCAVDLDFLRRTYFTRKGDKRHAWGVLFSFCVLFCFFLFLFQCHLFSSFSASLSQWFTLAPEVIGLEVRAPACMPTTHQHRGADEVQADSCINHGPMVLIDDGIKIQQSYTTLARPPRQPFTGIGASSHPVTLLKLYGHERHLLHPSFLPISFVAAQLKVSLSNTGTAHLASTLK